MGAAKLASAAAVPASILHPAVWGQPLNFPSSPEAPSQPFPRRLGHRMTHNGHHSGGAHRPTPLRARVTLSWRCLAVASASPPLWTRWRVGDGGLVSCRHAAGGFPADLHRVHADLAALQSSAAPVSFRGWSFGGLGSIRPHTRPCQGPARSPWSLSPQWDLRGWPGEPQIAQALVPRAHPHLPSCPGRTRARSLPAPHHRCWCP